MGGVQSKNKEIRSRAILVTLGHYHSAIGFGFIYAKAAVIPDGDTFASLYKLK